MYDNVEMLMVRKEGSETILCIKKRLGGNARNAGLWILSVNGSVSLSQ